MVDIVNIQENLSIVSYLIIYVRYTLLKNIVADKYGNLFILPHFNEKRTTNFKQLKIYKNGNRKAINYKKSNVSFVQLTKMKYIVDEMFRLPLDYKKYLL